MDHISLNTEFCVCVHFIGQQVKRQAKHTYIHSTSSGYYNPEKKQKAYRRNNCAKIAFAYAAIPQIPFFTVLVD